MQKSCAHCAQQFEITDEDLKFYDKVSPVFAGKICAIPPPTLCPDCRMQRLASWRNERFLYNRECDLTGEQIVSIYSSDKPFKVYGVDEWWSDKWDATDYGQKYDPSKKFFEQFAELMWKVPRMCLFNSYQENALYGNHATHNKNCYLVFASFYDEDVYYSRMVHHGLSILDCNSCFEKCELCYECIQCKTCYNLRYSRYCSHCSDSAFLFDCHSCTNCYRCAGLRNKEYCIGNKQYAKEEYKKLVPKLNSAKQVHEEKKKFDLFLLTKPQPANHFINCENCIGDELFDCKNCTNCYGLETAEDCKNIETGEKIKDCMDCLGIGTPGELLYEIHGMLSGYSSAFCNASYFNSNIYYCDNCQNSNNLFGCVGLRRASYCIFNKQYTREEYEKLMPQIIDDMSKNGEWGEFFPSNISPFAYNETIANEYFPLAKKEVLQKGLKWKDDEQMSKKAGGPVIIQDNIDDVEDNILKEILVCESCNKNYKLLQKELNLYRKMGVPVPRNCPNCRHLERASQTNPHKIYDRKCAKCSAEIKTTYAPDRPEIVYCEQCYLKEIY